MHHLPSDIVAVWDVNDSFPDAYTGCVDLES